MCKITEVMSHLLKIIDRFCLNLGGLVWRIFSLSSRYFEFQVIKFIGGDVQ